VVWGVCLIVFYGMFGFALALTDHSKEKFMQPISKLVIPGISSLGINSCMHAIRRIRVRRQTRARGFGRE
jgi:hypothetical protein